MGSNTQALAVPSSAVPTAIAPDRSPQSRSSRPWWVAASRTIGWGSA